MSVTTSQSASLAPWIRSPARWLCAALASAGLAACSIPLQQPGDTAGREAAPPTLTHAQQQPPAAPARDLGRPLPQALSYRGVMPCADCENQHITLTLLPDWTWRMRRVYQYAGGKPPLSIVTTGAWERGPDDANRVTLRGDRYENYQLQWVDGNRLKWLSQRGEPIPSALNAFLTQQFELDPIADVMPLRGKVSPQGSGIQFAVCGQGKAYPVSAQQQGRALQDNYQRLRIAPGTPVLMWVNGRFAMEGSPAQQVLIVESISTGTLDAPCE
ncbi:MAG: copper resistance protein NlpE N-terminal domain-containing protein [Pigmentiphaga sp.]|nr:copper resistance protein NlpE N-terminal domain-containing protein [Pigmentiphaga sp.]